MTVTLLHVSDSLVGTSGKTAESSVELGGLDAAIQRALGVDADAVIHTGNLFQKPNPDRNAIEAVADEVGKLASHGVRFFIIEGRRETYSDGEAIDRLQDQVSVRRLTAEPTIVDDVALYGVDHADDEAAFLECLDDLEPADAYTYNIVCVNQRIWPPLWEGKADVSSYDLMEATGVHVDRVLAGGVDEPQVWESDDFDYQVSYAGTTNPKKMEGGASPRGTLLQADADESSSERIHLVTTGVDAELAHLRDALDFGPSEIEDADTETLADLYGLAARAKSLFDQRRKELRDELLERVKEDQRIDGRYASVDRNTRRSRSIKSEDVVFETVERAGIDRDEVLKIDTSTLRDLVEEGKIDEDSIFDVEHRPYVRLGDITLDVDHS